MKALLCAALALPYALLAQDRQILPIDPKSSVLTWTGHAEVGPYAPTGTLGVRDGQVILQHGTFAGATLTVDMTSMTQSNADLLHHLESTDFFDVEHYPVAVIHIDRFANGTVFGTMTLKGKTAPLQAPVRLAGTDGHFSIEGKVTLDRTEYGIVYNSKSFFSGLGDKAIRNTFEVDFSLKGVGSLPSLNRL